MNDDQALAMMQRCLSEIKSMRRHIDHITPKAEAYETIFKILSYLPSPNRYGETEDIVFILEREIKKMEPDDE